MMKGKETTLSVLALLLAVMSLVSVFFAVYLFALKPSQKVYLVADSEVKNLGVLRQQETHEVKFSLKNTSKHPVEIGKINVSCGCTGYSVTDKTIPPNESTVLTLTFNTESARGDVEVSSLVHYKIPALGFVNATVVRLAATIEADYEVKPNFLTFSDSSPRTQQIVVTPRDGELVDVLEAECTRNYIEVKILPRIDSTQSCRIEVTYSKEKLQSADTGAEITVVTNNSTNRSFMYQLASIFKIQINNEHFLHPIDYFDVGHFSGCRTFCGGIKGSNDEISSGHKTRTCRS